MSRAGALAPVLVAVLALALAVAAAPGGPRAAGAALEPGLFLDLGRGPVTGPYTTRSYADTAGIRIFVERDSVPRPEGVEFLLGFHCRVDSACGVTRSLRILSFQPDTSLVSGAERITCDNLCLCDSCLAPAHYRVHFRADRLSTLPLNLRAPVGTLRVRTELPMTPADLHFELAYLWTFGASPFEVRALAVRGRTNTARIGGVGAGGATRWGVLRLMYR